MKTALAQINIRFEDKTANEDTVRKYIREGKLSEVDGKIPVMSIARLLCS